MSKIFFINVWRKTVFDIYIHWIWYCFENYFTYFVPVFKYVIVTAGAFEP